MNANQPFEKPTLPEPTSDAVVQCGALLAAIRSKKEMWRSIPSPQSHPRIEELRWVELWVMETVDANKKSQR